MLSKELANGIEYGLGLENENEIGWPRQQQMRGALNNSNQKNWLGTTDVLRLLIAEGSVANNQQETSELPEVIDSWVANLIQELATSKDQVTKSVTARYKGLHGPE